MLLLLIRHGVTPETGVRLTRPGVALSAEGERQAAALVDRLADVPLDAIYSSPLLRAVQTIKPLSTKRSMKIRLRQDLADVKYGSWEGKPLAALAKTKEFRQVVAAPSLGRFPGGESLAETNARAIAAVSLIVQEHPRQSVAVVCHADIIKMALAHYGGIHLDHYARLSIAPASVSAVWVGGSPRILRVNDTGGLSDLAPDKRPKSHSKSHSKSHVKGLPKKGTP